ncbi:MAG: HAMP domain-containing methyl-accepting chemotaxis protein [bacterium]
MITWNIRNQILGSGLIGLLVIVGVIAYFYSFTKGEFIGHSQAMIGNINGQFAREIDGAFESQTRTLHDWTSDDVFGLTIEFNTTGELGEQFSRWLNSADGFNCLALVDDRGQVLEIQGAAGLPSSPTRYQGGILPDWSKVRGQGTARVSFLRSQMLRDLGLENDQSYAYYFPAHSSDGNVNGAFVAFTDWSLVNEIVQECTKAFKEHGFGQARCLVASTDDHGVLYDFSLSGQPLDNEGREAAVAWFRQASNKVVSSWSLQDEAVLSGCHWLTPPAVNDDQQAGTSMVLSTIIPESEVMRQLNAALVMILIIGAVGSLLAMAMNYFVARRISRRIARGTRIATAMSQGDIDQYVDIHGRDEIGELGKAFSQLGVYMTEMSAAAEQIANSDLTVSVEPRSERDVLGRSFKTMIENLSGVVGRLSGSAEELVGVAAMINDNSQNISSGVQEQVGQINQVSAAIEEMAVTIQQSSRNATAATDASKNASESAVSGGNIVSETIGGMQRIAEVVRESAQSISDLAKSADQIGEITGVIDEIADQTNLLALNAAIEAARAGEQGRGFAVVADEVRKLAERTGKATGEITAMIKGIQSQTEQAVSSMEAGVQEVDKGRELVDRAGVSLSEIVNESQRVMDMIQQIATASEEQAAAAEEVSRNVEHISEVTESTARRSDQSSEAARNLNAQAEELNGIVARFRFKS